jgi:hypothetical protein
MTMQCYNGHGDVEALYRYARMPLANAKMDVPYDKAEAMVHTRRHIQEAYDDRVAVLL